MAKLQPLKISGHDNFAKRYEYVFPISVDASGLFHAQVPDDMAGQVLARDYAPLKKYDCEFGRFRNGKKTWGTHGDPYEVCGMNYKHLTECMKQVVADFVNPETTTKRVILYAFTSDCHYYIHGDGRIAPNGEKSTGGGAWNEKTSSRYGDAGEYTVGFRAQICDKTTYTRGTDVCVHYKIVSNPLGQDGLNIFCHVDKLFDTGCNNFNHGLVEGAREIDWSEDCEKKCYNAMLNICKLAHSLQTVFKKENPFLTEFKFMQLPEGK